MTAHTSIRAANASSSSNQVIAMKLPLKIALEFIKRHEDTWTYEIEVSVPASEVSTTIATIESDLDGHAKVVEVQRDGLLSLDAPSLSNLLVGLFRFAYRQMTSQDGSAIEWSLSDVSHLIRKHFSPEAAAQISIAIASFADPAVDVRDVIVVRMD
jgi:hypothetical protein